MKMYVVSGELSQVVSVPDSMGPITCVKRALELNMERNGVNVELDAHYVYMDERGPREGEDAQFRVPVEKALAEAGYIFEDDDDEFESLG